MDARARLQELAKKVTNALDMEDAKFRSVYLPLVRDAVPRSLDVFDFPDSSLVSGNRESSNTPNQALYLMNNAFVLQQSEAFAKRVASTENATDERIRLAFTLAYGRPPTSGERSATSRFVRDIIATGSSRERANVFPLLCQSLFASAEFRYID